MLFLLPMEGLQLLCIAAAAAVSSLAAVAVAAAAATASAPIRQGCPVSGAEFSAFRSKQPSISSPTLASA